MSYTLTPEAFRAAHPELASRAWIEDANGQSFICWPDRLSGDVSRIQLGVPLCECCDLPVAECEDAPLAGDPLLRRNAA